MFIHIWRNDIRHSKHMEGIMAQRVLILGASGKIGKHSAEAFAKAGWEVRRYDRKAGDMVAAAQGCDVIVNGLNPPNYHNWAKIIPQITTQVIAAAKAAGATVIVPGNVYHFGDQGGEWSENTPANPVSRKGHIRLAMERSYAASGVQTIVLRAGNFIDPDLDGCVMGAMYLPRVKRGVVVLPGGADVRQALCYLPDWARAAVALAEIRGSLAPFADIPFAGHTLTAQEIKTHCARTLQRDMRFARFPWWLMRAASPVWELARELQEMRYLWNTDHSLSPQKLQSLLPDFTPTPTEAVFRRILA